MEPDLVPQVRESPIPRRRSESSRRRSRAERLASSRWLIAAQSAFALTLIVAPQLLAGDPGWARATIAALSLATVSLCLVATWDRIARTPVPRMIVLPVLALVWTGAQVLPLPCEFTRSLAPQSVQETRRAYEAAAMSEPALCSISRDVGRTENALVTGSALLLILISAWLLAGVAERRDNVMRMVGFSVVAVTLAVFAHELAHATTVYGLYTPVHASPRWMGPILNDNHLGGFLAMGAPVLLALAVDEEHKGRRALWMIAAVMSIALGAMTPSRGGIAALGGGIVLFMTLLYIVRRARRRSGRTHETAVFRWLFLILAAGLGLGIYTGATVVLRDITSHDTSKLDIARAGFNLATESSFWGLGRGAFTAAFVQHVGDNSVRFEYPENIFVQWTSEWGFFIGAGLLLALAWSIARSGVFSRSVIRVSACVALITIGVHDLVDFSLEMTGIAALAAALFAITLTATSHERDNAVPKSFDLSRNVFLGIVTFVAIPLLLFAPGAHARDAFAQERAISDAFRNNELQDFRALAKKAMLDHPSEPVFPLLWGTEGAKHNQAGAIRLLNRAMLLAPKWSSPHLIAAEWLFRHGRTDQALLEIRETASRTPNQTRGVMCTLLRERDDAALAFRAAPEGDGRIVFLDLAAGCIDARSNAATAIDEELKRIAPNLSSPRLRDARRALAQQNPQQAVEVLQEALQRTPSDTRLTLALADALVAANRASDAVSVLRRDEAHFAPSGRIDMLRVRARAQAAANDETGMRKTIDDLRGLTSDAPHTFASTLTLLGQLEASRRNYASALRAYEEAQRAHPSPSTLDEIGALAERIGDYSRAYAVYDELCGRGPGNGRACDSKNRLMALSRERDLRLQQQNRLRSTTLAP